MEKWQYLRLGQVTTAGFWIAPAAQFDAKWLSQKYPTAKLKSDGTSLTISQGKDNRLELYYAVIEYLCAEGWEPFAVDGTLMHFKRSL